jgi:hypothetical protein
MDYRGKTYTIVQGIIAKSWKWTVYLDDKSVKTGDAISRIAARLKAEAFINRALAPKKAKLTPPPPPPPPHELLD